LGEKGELELEAKSLKSQKCVESNKDSQTPGAPPRAPVDRFGVVVYVDCVLWFVSGIIVVGCEDKM
jgi:hypothetical protein